MLIRIPPFNKRGKSAEVLKSIWANVKHRPSYDYSNENDYSFSEESIDEDDDEASDLEGRDAGNDTDMNGYDASTSEAVV